MPPVIPPGTALGPGERDRLQALIVLIRGAMAELQGIALLMEDPRDARYVRRRMVEANAVIDRLLKLEEGRASGEIVDWAREHVPATYGHGSQLAMRDLTTQGVAAAIGDARIHTRAVEALLTRYVSDATEIVVQLKVNTIRATRVVLAQAGFGEQIAAGIVGGLPRQETSRLLKSAMRRAVSEAIPEGAHWSPADLTEIEIGGRTYQLDTWAEMHARTETARVVSAGTRTTTVQNGALHIQVTSHAHEPCICTPFEGRIYRLFEDRGDMRFPHVSVMPNGGVPLHPNCVHREAPAVIEFLEERGDVEGRAAVPAGIERMDERELARWVRQNRGRLGRYSRRRDGILPENFRVRQAVAA